MRPGYAEAAVDGEKVETGGNQAGKGGGGGDDNVVDDGHAVVDGEHDVAVVRQAGERRRRKQKRPQSDLKMARGCRHRLTAPAKAEGVLVRLGRPSCVSKRLSEPEEERVSCPEIYTVSGDLDRRVLYLILQ